MLIFIKFLRILFFVNLHNSFFKGSHLMPSYAKIIVRVLASTKTNIANICEVHNDFSQLHDLIHSFYSV